MIDKIKLINPFVMAGGFFLLFFLIYLGHSGVSLISGAPMKDSDIWVYTFGGCMIYSIFGPIHVLLVSDTHKYYNQTFAAFFGLLVLSVLSGSLISGKSIFHLPIQRKVLVFVIIAFLVFISIAYLVRRLENWSRRYDENFLKSDKWDKYDDE